MNAKEQLQEVRRLDIEIHAMEAEGKRTAELLDYVSNQLGNGRETAAAIIALMELAVQIDERILRLDSISKDIRASIDNLKEARHRHVLILRYFLCKEWREIAAKTSYSERSVHRIHTAALVELDTILANITPPAAP